jgi:DNA-binding NarL/FixJ family response regulator
MAREQKRVIYLGGHALTRDAMRAALGRFGMHVIPVVSLQEALDSIDADTDAVMVDDEGMTDEAILEAVTVCAQKQAGLKVGVVSASRSAVLPADAIRAGASAYLSKDMPLPELRFALERMLAGQLVVDPMVTRTLLSVFGGIAPATNDDGHANGNGNGNGHAAHLTPIERKVLLLASDGKANKQIAHSLNLSPLTVKNHIARIRARLGAADKAHAVAVALRNGLID